jgi:hypothetical protein
MHQLTTLQIGLKAYETRIGSMVGSVQRCAILTLPRNLGVARSMERGGAVRGPLDHSMASAVHGPASAGWRDPRSMDISMDVFFDVSMGISIHISMDISMDITMDISVDISMDISNNCVHPRSEVHGTHRPAVQRTANLHETPRQQLVSNSHNKDVTISCQKSSRPDGAS